MNSGYHLNETQHRIYNYVIDSLNNNHKPTVTEVAENNFVSTTYVVKVAKQLGYEGYSEFLYVSNWLLTTSHSHDESQVLLLDSLEIDDIRSLANTIYNYSNTIIYLVAVGYSDLAATFFIKKFTEIGIFCYSGSPFDMKIDTTNSLVIFISRSGETEDILSISRKLPAHYRKVLISTTDDATISSTVDKTYVIPNESHSHRLPIPDLFLSKVITFFEYVYSEVRNISKKIQNNNSEEVK